MKKTKVFYYKDELNDDYYANTLKPKKIDGNYKYKRKGLFKKIIDFICYNIIARPFVFLYSKIKFRWKIVGKKKFKQVKSGYFLYGNHTQALFDAATPLQLSSKRAYVLVNPDNLNMKGIGWILPKVGALPLPGDIQSTKNFISNLDDLVKKDNVIAIFPEAHCWPYYTHIRNFKSTAFRYPVKYNKPTYCFTTTYHKTKFRKTPKIITYVDGPFYSNTELPPKQAEQELRDNVYNAMVERSKNSDIEIIKYIKED